MLIPTTTNDNKQRTHPLARLVGVEDFRESHTQRVQTRQLYVAGGQPAAGSRCQEREGRGRKGRLFRSEVVTEQIVMTVNGGRTSTRHRQGASIAIIVEGIKMPKLSPRRLRPRRLVPESAAQVRSYIADRLCLLSVPTLARNTFRKPSSWFHNVHSCLFSGDGLPSGSWPRSLWVA